MEMSEQQIKAMVIMNIIDNCTMELDNTGQERYSLNGQQFGKCVDTLVKNINVIHCCKSDSEQLHTEVFNLANKLAINGYGNEAIRLHVICNGM